MGLPHPDGIVIRSSWFQRQCGPCDLLKRVSVKSSAPPHWKGKSIVLARSLVTLQWVIRLEIPWNCKRAIPHAVVIDASLA